MSRLRKLLHEIHRRSIWQVLSVYLVGGWVVLGAADTVANLLGLPDWSSRFALYLLIIGLPIVLATAIVQSSPSSGSDDSGSTPGPTPGRLPSRRVALLTWRNALTGGVLALALWGVVASVWLFLLRPDAVEGEVAVGADVIAILPFTVSGDAPLTGDGMVDLLSASLDQVGPIRTVPPQTVLARWERAAGAGRTDHAAGLEIGRQVRAGSILSGSIVSAGPELRVDATLYTVSGDQLARARVSGSAGAPLALVDSLTIALLREIWRSRSPVPNLSISAVSTTNLTAIRHYLEGVALYRRTEWADAADAFRRAVEADSTFALAHLRLAETYGWGPSFAGNQEERYRRIQLHGEAAIRFGERLPERERSEARIRQLRRSASAAVAEDSLVAFIRRYPEDANGWNALAETRFHSYAAMLGDRAELFAPFERVVELDPTARTLFAHLPQLIMGFADSTAFRRYLDAMVSAGDPSVSELRMVRQAIWQSVTPDEAAAGLAHVPEGFYSRDIAFATAFRSHHDPRAVVDAFQRLYERSPADSEVARMAQLASNAFRRALGQTARAEELLPAGIVPEPWDAYEFAAQRVLAGFATPDDLMPDPGERDVEPEFRHLWLALVALHRGDAATARAHADSGLAATPEVVRLEYAPRFGAVRGWANIIEGDTIGGLLAMEAAFANAPAIFLDAIRDYAPEDNILLFRLATGLAAHEQTRERGLRLLSGPWLRPLEFEVLAHFHRARALDAAGDAEGARAEYAWFVNALSEADPDMPVQALVEQAQNALAALGRERG